MNRHTLSVMALLLAGVASCEKGKMGDELNNCKRCTYTFRENTGEGSLIFEYKHYLKGVWATAQPHIAGYRLKFLPE